MSLTKLCGLFERKDKRGDTYYCGAFGLAKITVMRNAYKGTAGEPDYYLCIVPNSELTDSKGNGTQAGH